MRRYRLMDISAQREVITTPNINTETMTTIITPGVITANKSGSYFTKAYASPINAASAAAPASIPTHTLRIRNGRRMNDQLAPTSFMVCIRKRLE